ncbi:uncharacterized protein LOC119833039 [Zerene cesonia]|uniref:uncharacterized protein LOC119833039 n=1 Tax=Zerene cesonia TaxID=33412 RepID=UPI0018E56ADF|nr:uncharacterized protein LOC119833039 [Zerene cesonia]
MIKNSTFNVSSLFQCEFIDDYKDEYEHDPIWSQTYAGCLVLLMLQDMYKFKFGFLLRYKRERILHTFYSLPFTPLVWSCIIVILFLSSLIFYILSYWEKRIVGGECSYCHELLLAFSAFCQHILPLHANLYSRRIAYLFFILCSYVIHCFYTSNLLSHIVNDNDRDMDLMALARSDYEFAIIQDTNFIVNRPIQQVPMDKNLSLVRKKMRNIKIMNVSSGLEALKDTKTAILSDYNSLYPIIKRSFDKDVICDLIEVDLYSMAKKYFYTSKQFAFKEEFKSGILRAKETGLVRRMILLKIQQAFSCDHERSYSDYTIIPIIILLSGRGHHEVSGADATRFTMFRHLSLFTVIRLHSFSAPPTAALI